MFRRFRKLTTKNTNVRLNQDVSLREPNQSRQPIQCRLPSKDPSLLRDPTIQPNRRVRMGNTGRTETKFGSSDGKYARVIKNPHPTLLKDCINHRCLTEIAAELI
ncbi:hypothetical protein Hanom_Chr07g00595891 [Helianthus anomalus]